MSTMQIPTIPDSVELPAEGGIDRRVHVFSDYANDDARNAILAALGASRPLLVRGEPGVGKTQLAEAVAVALNRRLLSFVVDSRTEPHDLLFSFDAVRRLAEAQLCAAIHSPALTSESTDREKAVRRRLAPRRFVVPGMVWWAFDWKSAMRQARRASAPRPFTVGQWENAAGTVLLIDEIDKAETDVPNGLLEALGQRKFTPPGGHKPVVLQGATPLVVITTNEERALPDPFVRRCVVLNLFLPGKFQKDGTNDVLRDWLVARADALFETDTADSVTARDVLVAAADQLVADRWRAIKEQWTPLPGQAEYLDLVRAVVELDKGRANASAQLKRLSEIGKFMMRKHRIVDAP